MASNGAELGSLSSVRALLFRAAARAAPGARPVANRAKSANQHISNPINSVIRSAESAGRGRCGCMVIWLVMALIEDNSGNWRVGVLFSQTGVTSAIERTQLNATLLAIEEINTGGGILGRYCQ